MIKINLLTERKQPKAKPSQARAMKVEGVGTQGFLLVGILLLGVLVAGGWWWMLSNERANWVRKHEEADRELKRLEEVRKKGDEYKKQKDLLARKIQLITDLKKKQAVPVQILDLVSQSLPEFLWLESMSSANNQISLTGKATAYQAVSKFYSNLADSGRFTDVTLGRTFEVPEGVSFSLTCKFAPIASAEEAAAPAAPAPAPHQG